MHTLVVEEIGRRDYLPTLDLQVELRDKVRSDPSTEYLILVEHPPVITLGRCADRENLLADERELRLRGFELHETSRGGDVTYHGPGQVVGYPIIDLSRHRVGVREYMRGLEEVVIRTLGRFDIDAGRMEGLTGVWVPAGKIAAIGVAVRQWVTYHGFALNVNTDLGRFSVINPCGITDRGVTSMSAVLGRPVDEESVRKTLVEEFRAVFGFARGAKSGPTAERRIAEASSADDPESPLPQGEMGRGVAAANIGNARHGGRLPAWLRKRLPRGGDVEEVRSLLASHGLHTVCQSARCPNIWECFSRKTATFMILGDRCTRTCRFCAVRKGSPGPVDADEPARVAKAAKELGLRHVVITSVTRDDLGDGGAAQFARTISAVRDVARATVEVLTPDFGGDAEAIRTVVDARPEVYNHNLETVRSLYAHVRPEARYERSLELLKLVKQLDAEMLTKSGLMVGLGEETNEVWSVLADLRRAGCDMLTLGQYLAPSKDHLPVARFVPPEEFDEMGERARAMGFAGVASGPFVRSSHGAAELYLEAREGRARQDIPSVTP